MLVSRPSRFSLAFSLFAMLASAGSIVSVTFCGTLTNGSMTKDYFPIAG